MSDPVAKRRKTATFDAALDIHGNREGALAGLWATFASNATAEELSKTLKSSKKVKKAVPKLLHPYIKEAKKQYEESNENFIRSLATLYEGGLISRKKYNSERVTNKSSPGPNYVTYNKLQEYISKTIETPNLVEIPLIKGYKCNLDEILRHIAIMYLKWIPDKINWFQNEGTFLLAFGGDGAPLGKFSECSSFLISFINVGHFVLSCDHSFTVIAGYCQEDDPAFLQALQDLAEEMKVVEDKVYTIQGRAIRFRFTEFLADQKFLANVSGELNNAARYPSPFGNVQNDEIGDASLLRKQGRPKLGPDEYWEPWSEEDKVKQVKEVNTFKAKQNTKLKAKTRRQQLLNHMAERGSRQEHLPYMGQYCEMKRPDPLHLRNNCWEGWHTEVLTSVVRRSSNVGKISDIATMEDCPLKSYLLTLQEIKANILLRKVLEWWNDDKKGKTFATRFTGETSLKIAQNYMKICQCIENDTYRALMAYTAKQLRNISALVAKVDVTDGEQYLKQLDDTCFNFYVAKCLAGGKVKLSDWTLGFAVPFHAEDIWKRYECGYGIISMQGREAKNIRLKSYIKFTRPGAQRWKKAMGHEYIHTVYLPTVNGRNKNYFKKRKARQAEQYVHESSPEVCDCGQQISPGAIQCAFCSSDAMKEVIKSIKNIQLTKKALRELNRDTN